MNTIHSARKHGSSVPEVASIVHDLRNPLRAIHGGAELLVDSSLSQPQIHRIARNMYGASLRMKELLDELLNRWVSREREAEFCDLRDLIASAVDEIAVIAESESVRIVRNLPDRLVVAVERHRMQSVVVNLLVNALEAMSTGGTIDISAVFDECSFVIHVCDSGPGISSEIRHRLLQPFATAGKVNGFGLGRHFHGRLSSITAERCGLSRLKQGAYFAVRRPRTIPQGHSGLMRMPLALEDGESMEPPRTTPAVALRAQGNRQFS